MKWSELAVKVLIGPSLAINGMLSQLYWLLKCHQNALDVCLNNDNQQAV